MANVPNISYLLGVQTTRFVQDSPAMARPKTGKARTERLSVSFTPAEIEELKAHAAAAEFPPPVATLVRSLALRALRDASKSKRGRRR